LKIIKYLYYKMEHLNWSIDNDPGVVVISSLIGGILFSNVTYGLAYLILFLLIWEILYFGYLDCNGKNWIFFDRILVFLAAILGFMLGRFMHDNDDHKEDFHMFKNSCGYYLKDFGWI